MVALRNSARWILKKSHMDPSKITWKDFPTQLLRRQYFDDEIREIIWANSEVDQRYFRSMILVDVLNKHDIAQVASGAPDMLNEHLAATLIRNFPDEFIAPRQFWLKDRPIWCIASFPIFSYRDISGHPIQLKQTFLDDLDTYPTSEYQLGTTRIVFETNSADDIHTYGELMDQISIEALNVIDSSETVFTVSLNGQNRFVK